MVRVSAMTLDAMQRRLLRRLVRRSTCGHTRGPMFRQGCPMTPRGRRRHSSWSSGTCTPTLTAGRLRRRASSTCSKPTSLIRTTTIRGPSSRIAVSLSPRSTSCAGATTRTCRRGGRSRSGLGPMAGRSTSWRRTRRLSPHLVGGGRSSATVRKDRATVNSLLRLPGRPRESG
jgi:hypothetical protein